MDEERLIALFAALWQPTTATQGRQELQQGSRMLPLLGQRAHQQDLAEHAVDPASGLS